MSAPFVWLFNTKSSFINGMGLLAMLPDTVALARAGAVYIGHIWLTSPLRK